VYCDPGCPSCPPGVFGSDGSGKDGDNDDDSDEHPTATYTGIYNVLTDDVYPTYLIAEDVASSLDSEVNSLVQSVFTTSKPKPSTAPTSKPPSTTPPTASPTPTADCDFYDAYFFLVFQIYNIAGWMSDKGEALKKQESGCGGLSGWTESAPNREYIFDLTYFIKAGCVERAIVSAGGPKIECQYQGTVDSDVVREPGRSKVVDVLHDSNGTRIPPLVSLPPYTDQELREIAEFYKSTWPTTAPHTGYGPLIWEQSAAKPRAT
jgi:chitinase